MIYVGILENEFRSYTNDFMRNICFFIFLLNREKVNFVIVVIN